MVELTPAEARVLGCLIEKEATTPEYYPLTLNSLVNACNQKSNRAPVVRFDAKTVVRALDGLREKKLAVQFAAAGARVPKYEHQARETLNLTQAEQALLCELLLRGPQTAGELRGRASRIYPFSSVEAVREVMQGLIEDHSEPLAMVLPRAPGRKEARYMHRLRGEPEAPVEAAAPPVEPAALEVRAEEERFQKLEEAVAHLEAEIAELRKILDDLLA